MNATTVVGKFKYKAIEGKLMFIASYVLNFEKFSWIWMIVTLIGSFVSPFIFILLLSTQLLKNPAVLAYWISVGVSQTIILQFFVPWAYQWGLVTVIAGSICFWLSGFVFVYLAESLGNPELSKVIDKDRKNFNIFFTDCRYILKDWLSINNSFNNNQTITPSYSLIIFPLIIFFIGGFLFGSCQFLLLWFDRVPVNFLLPIINGLTWSLGYIAYIIFASFEYPIGSRDLLSILLLLFPLSIINTGIGSLIKGLIMAVILNQTNS
ncbi:MAG: hypothetical protein ACRC2R_06915 [Xenococcaceae cyanobacterium]